MTPSEDLFHLIKCLSKPQKRYVHLFASIYSGDKTYLKLFDAVDKQKTYDEAAIKKKFRNEPFTKQLTRTKYYLYQMILKSLRNYRTQENIEKELREYIDDIEFLFGKQLYRQCLKLIHKARSRAETFESIPNLLEILKWEYMIAERLGYSEGLDEAVERSFETTLNSLSVYDNLTQYRLSMARVGKKFYKKGLIRDTSDLAYYESILTAPIYKDENRARSYQAKMLFHSSYATYYFLRKDYAKAYEHVKRSVLLMEQQKHRSESDVNTMVSAYVNMAACQVALKKYKEIELTIDRIEKLRISWGSKDDNFIKLISTEMGLCIELASYDRGIQIHKFHKQDIELAVKNNMDHRHLIIFNFYSSIIYFGMEDYSKAIIWINKVINDRTRDLRNDVYSFAMIYRLIIYIEMDKTDLLEYAIRSVHRFLTQRQRLYKFEHLMLKFITEYPIIKHERTKIKTAYLKLSAEMSKIFNDPLEATILDYFRFDMWVEGKIKQKKYKEITAEKIGDHGVGSPGTELEFAL